MFDKNDKSQSPAPKVSHAKDASEEKSTDLIHHMHEAEKEASNNPDATKTPEKIKNGDLSEQKKEY